MTVINFCFSIVKLTFLQVNEAIEEESYKSSDDNGFKQEESDGFSADLSDFVEEDEEELQALKDEVRQDMSSKKAAACVSTTSKKSPKKDSIDDVTKRLPLSQVPTTLAPIFSLGANTGRRMGPRTLCTLSSRHVTSPQVTLGLQKSCQVG